jgi:hypothetical protein
MTRSPGCGSGSSSASARSPPARPSPRLVHLGQGTDTAIGAFTDTWNDHPHPFAWTKDADEILSKIARAKTKTSAITDH